MYSQRKNEILTVVFSSEPSENYRKNGKKEDIRNIRDLFFRGKR